MHVFVLSIHDTTRWQGSLVKKTVLDFVDSQLVQAQQNASPDSQMSCCFCCKRFPRNCADDYEIANIYKQICHL